MGFGIGGKAGDVRGEAGAERLRGAEQEEDFRRHEVRGGDEAVDLGAAAGGFGLA